MVTVPLSKLLSDVDTPVGRDRLERVLNAQPFPHFESVPGKPGFLFRVTEDGQRTLGQFVGREFRANE